MGEWSMESRWMSWLRARVGSNGERVRPGEGAKAPLPTREWETLLETTRKSARAVLRLDTRLEGLEQQLAASSADVRALLARAERSEEAFWSPLMDAIDRLEGARDAIERGQVEGASEGLASIGSRLERLLAAAGYRRHGERGIPVDGRLHRVVGTLSLPGAPEGSVGRIVRAPVTRGDAVVRTGEVLAVKHSDGYGKQTT
jgi:molecular chaperone GrpE (heat shock protein)